MTRAKKLYVADYIYESDNQSTLARRYGWGLMVGRTIPEIDEWPKEIRKSHVTRVKKAAQKHLEIRRSVTGTLLPEADATPPAKRS